MKLPRFLANIVRQGADPSLVTRRNFDELSDVLAGYAGEIEGQADKINSLATKVAKLPRPAILGMGAIWDVKSFGTISAAVSYLGSTTATLYITNTQTVSANLTIPSNISVEVLKGGSFSIATGVTLTFAGPFYAGHFQVFTGAGTAAFSPGTVETVSPYWWGIAADADQADPDDWTNDTAAFTAAQTAAASGGGVVVIPAGSYAVNLTIIAGVEHRGAGIRRVILKPFSTATPTVLIYGNGSGDNNIGMTLHGVSITGDGTEAGVGLEIGDSLSALGCSNSGFERIEISGFEYGIRLMSAIMCNFKLIYALENEYGLFGNNEANVTTCHFDTCRFRLNDYGIYLATGMIMSFTNSNCEANNINNLRLFTGITNGPSKIDFCRCWFEAIQGTTEPERASIYLDMHFSIGQTKPVDVYFYRCVITAQVGIYDLFVNRGQGVHFEHCAFSATADAFTSTKFGFTPSLGASMVRLTQCGNLQEIPTEAMYASFPSLERTDGGVFGIFYEFIARNGRRYTNYENLTVAADCYDQQVAYLKTLSIDTTLNTRIIDSLIGGSEGQILVIQKPVSANTVRVLHDGPGFDPDGPGGASPTPGTEQIFTRSGAYVDLVGNESMAIIFQDGAWYEIGYDLTTIAKALSVLGLTVTKNSTALSPTVLAQGQIPRYALNYQGSGSASNQNWWEWSVGSDEMGMRVRADDGTAGTTIISWKRPSGNAVVAMQMGCRLQHAKGANVASANDLVLGTDGDLFTITGSTTVQRISRTHHQSGSIVILDLPAGLVIQHNVATGSVYDPIFLKGLANWTVGGSGGALALYYNGSAFREIARTDYAYPDAKYLTASATWDPGNLAADGDATSTTIAVTGAATGDQVSASLTTIGANNVLISAHVQAADTVRVTLMNKTGGALDIASGTLAVKVWK